MTDLSDLPSWLIANWALVLSIGGLFFIILGAIFRRPVLLVISIILSAVASWGILDGSENY